MQRERRRNRTRQRRTPSRSHGPAVRALRRRARGMVRGGLGEDAREAWGRALAEPVVRQPAAAAGVGSSLRAAAECARLSREEISTNARIAPTRAKPAPTRNARSNPLVKA